ncbi:MAG: hypothetical protein JW779_14395 [Candidatus Thorarchaeota archaeon]|nr:hypothetical protein [Candidatus Thorarchaeota archaeon]
MRKNHPVQTRLADFNESPLEKPASEGPCPSSTPVKRHPAKLWRKTIRTGEVWGVFDVDDTVLFVQIIDGRIHAHGREAICKYCGSPLDIRGTQVFCSGTCGSFQGNFSYDVNHYLHWNGAKSLTVRKEIASEEGLKLEERDLESINYAPQWSSLYDYEEFDDEENEME